MKRLRALVFCGEGEDFKLLLQVSQDGLPAFPQVEQEKLLDLQGQPLSPRNFGQKTELLPLLFYANNLQEKALAESFPLAQWFLLDQVECLAKGEGAILNEALSYFWKGFKASFLPEVELPKKFRALNNLTEITLFAGSFRPFHQGHEECLRLCPKGPVVVVPDYNPWKEAPETSCYFKFYQELVAKVPDAYVYPGFCGKETPNPTSEWLPSLPFSKINLLMGEDLFLSLPQWKAYEKVLEKLTKIFIVPRNENQNQVNQMKEKLSSFQVEFEVLPHHKFEELSSSQIREKKR